MVEAICGRVEFDVGFSHDDGEDEVVLRCPGGGGGGRKSDRLSGRTEEEESDEDDERECDEDEGREVGRNGRRVRVECLQGKDQHLCCFHWVVGQREERGTTEEATD